jgi:hypothetical protein
LAELVTVASKIWDERDKARNKRANRKCMEKKE